MKEDSTLKYINGLTRLSQITVNSKCHGFRVPPEDHPLTKVEHIYRLRQHNDTRTKR